MKTIAAVLLVCLLVTGTVSAVSMSVGSVQAAKTVVPANTAQTQKISASGLPGALVTPVAQEIVEVYSNPSGAAITLSGISQPGEKTPLKYFIPAGTYTIVLSLAGYQDYTETFTLNAGTPKNIHAELKPKISASLVRAQMTGIPVTGVMPPAPIPTTGLTYMPTTVETTYPVHYGLVSDCNNVVGGSQCMLLSDAAQTFTGEWGYITDRPCGYAIINNINFTKYCCWEEQQGSIHPLALKAAVPIAAGPGVKIVASGARFYDPNLTLVPVVRGAVVQRQKDFFSSFLGLFSGLFGAKTCPAGQLSCDGTCVDPGTDAQNCGKCGMTCNTNFTCCNGECADRQWDSENCGTCGMTCFAPAFCCAGSCEEICDQNGLNSQPWGDLL
jgi:Stigma-specific protein, Stig1/PEGA domain